MLVAIVAVSGALGAQTGAKKPASLGSVKIGRSVMADGKPLAAGTYTLRVSDETPAAVVGQSPDETRWVEFVQAGAVKGRELATVLSKDALKQMTRKSAPPAAGSAKVELLKGDDYIRVWVNAGGTQYLIHLALK
ncbi:MAG: hypothetical protein EPO35_05615 [Acidobacteria bacterium]|nr:MAG: hypothetical protein EPO35_05615 [Acidobacteriota bacterium]